MRNLVILRWITVASIGFVSGASVYAQESTEGPRRAAEESRRAEDARRADDSRQTERRAAADHANTADFWKRNKGQFQDANTLKARLEHQNATHESGQLSSPVTPRAKTEGSGGNGRGRGRPGKIS
jgi:hypothetical protein